VGTSKTGETSLAFHDCRGPTEKVHRKYTYDVVADDLKMFLQAEAKGRT
jgi:hypothetical protein